MGQQDSQLNHFRPDLRRKSERVLDAALRNSSTLKKSIVLSLIIMYLVSIKSFQIMVKMSLHITGRLVKS